MLKLIFGVTQSIFKGLYLLILPLILIRLFTKRRESLLRRILRTSYHLYSSLLKWINPYVVESLGINILEGYPRIIATTLLSFGIGYAILSVLHIRLRFWLVAIFVLHGLFVGKQWGQIIASEDFQMGARIDE